MNNQVSVFAGREGYAAEVVNGLPDMDIVLVFDIKVDDRGRRIRKIALDKGRRFKRAAGNLCLHESRCCFVHPCIEIALPGFQAIIDN